MDAKTPPPDNKLASKMIPALAAYLNRVGAEECNFRRFVVKETGENGYPIDRAVIKIEGGTISCSSPDHAPTDDEKAAIESALKDAEFPRSIGFPSPATLCFREVSPYVAGID